MTIHTKRSLDFFVIKSTILDFQNKVDDTRWRNSNYLKDHKKVLNL